MAARRIPKCEQRPDGELNQTHDDSIAVPLKRRVSAEECAEAYARLGSIWLAGDELGIAGQTVFKKLKAAGISTSKPYVLDAEREAVRVYYETTPASEFSVQVIASQIGRSVDAVYMISSRMGLTTPGRPHNAATVARLKLRKWPEGTHPKGMLGHKHTDETKLVISAKSKVSWSTAKTFGIGHCSPENLERRSVVASARMAARPADTVYTRGVGGRRDDLDGMYFRSSWEANYARYLNLLVKFGVVLKWDFEQETFWFSGVKRGVVSYRPDFRVWYKGDAEPIRVEIKGYETDKDRTKWRRLKKYHPDIKLEIVGAKEYRALTNKWASAIPEWETAKRRRA